jgi:hypothetical protein
MAVTAADWTIDRDTGNIRYIGGDHDGTGGTPSYATVIEFHRWLQDLADDAVATPASSDELDITNTNPSQRSTDNIITLINNYNIDDNASEHLYDGSIIQNSGDDIYDGIVNFGNADVQIQIIQNGAVLTDDWWNYNSAGLNASATAGISHRFMIKTRSGGTDIDSRKLIGTARRFGYTYQEFTINSTARGNNVLALADASDLNNQTAIGTVAAWTFTNLVEGYNSMDVNNDGTNENYYSKWDIDTGTNTINDFYEYMKWLTRDGSASTLYGLNGELFRGITHQVAYSSLTGTFDDSNVVSWTGTNTGTGQIIADNGSDMMWIQVLTGTAPTSSDSLSQTTPDAASATTGAVSERTVSKPFAGQSTGSALIGAYGVGVNNVDLSASDQLTDLSNTVRTPPNNVTNTVSGLASGEDRVLVAPYDGVTSDTNGDPAITKTQLSLDAALTTDNITSVVVTESIPNFTPSTGYIRLTDNNGYERRLHYSAVNTSTRTFTIDTTDGNEDFLSVNASIGNDVYIAYIDELASSTTASFTSVHAVGAGTMNLVVIVRDGGGTPIKQYIAPWTQTDSNSSITVIRTSDT